MTIYEIIKKLIGSIEPYGDTNIDEARLNNLNEHMILVNSLIEDLVRTAKYRNRQESSIHNLGSYAYDELLNIKDIIFDEIEEGDL